VKCSLVMPWRTASLEFKVKRKSAYWCQHHRVISAQHLHHLPSLFHSSLKTSRIRPIIDCCCFPSGLPLQTRFQTGSSLLISFRPHRLRAYATGVARSVVFVSVCLCFGHTGELSKNGWTDRDVVWGLNHVSLTNNILHGGQYRTNSFAAHLRGVTSRRCDLLPNYFGHVIF